MHKAPRPPDELLPRLAECERLLEEAKEGADMRPALIRRLRLTVNALKAELYDAAQGYAKVS